MGFLASSIPVVVEVPAWESIPILEVSAIVESPIAISDMTVMCVVDAISQVRVILVITLLHQRR